jgi:hypothetical protein
MAAFFVPIFAKLALKFCRHILYRNVTQIERKLHNIRGKVVFSPLSKVCLPLYRFSQHSKLVSGTTWRSSTSNHAQSQSIWQLPIPVAARPSRGSEAARLLGLWVRIPLSTWMLVSCVCCVVCRQRPLRRADQSSRGILPSTVCI